MAARRRRTHLRAARRRSVRLNTLRNPRLRVHWTDRASPGTRSLVGALGCVLEVVRTQPAAIAFCVVESALALGKITVSQWRRAAQSLPQETQRKLGEVSKLSGSGGESWTKFELIGRGIPFRQQIQLHQTVRVDFLIGRLLVIEIDGSEFHTSPDAFEEDRRRDAVLRALGFRVLRFSYKQVTERWYEVIAAIDAAITSGEHLR